MEIHACYILELAEKEILETVALSFPTRRRLWEAMGPWEPKDAQDNTPRTLTESLKRRAALALACGKKISRVWSAYSPEDRHPQELLKKTDAYLSGKLEAGKLIQAWNESDYMNRSEDDPYSAAPLAAIAIERAATAALYDEPLLHPDYADAADEDLDPYDWDTAWCASIAWISRDEDASPGRQKVEELKFWSWYLEEAARLLGVENYRFPKKAIRAFESKQELSRQVPAEVTLESFTDFLGIGEYRYHFYTKCTNFNQNSPRYEIYASCRGQDGICPKCKTHVTKAEFWYAVNCLEDTLPGTKICIQLVQTLPLFHCPEHPDISFTPEQEHVNPKAALKRYLAEPGREEELLNQLEGRRADVFQIGEGYVSLNGDTQHHHNVRIPANVRGIRWLNRTTEELEVDLRQFGPNVYFKDMTLEQFCQVYPDQVCTLESGILQITMERHWIRCWLDTAGALERVVVVSRFHLEVDRKRHIPLIRFLITEFHLTRAQAETIVEEKTPAPLAPFSNLTRAEALRLCTALRSAGIKCRVMPVPLDTAGDTILR